MSIVALSTRVQSPSTPNTHGGAARTAATTKSAGSKRVPFLLTIGDASDVPIRKARLPTSFGRPIMMISSLNTIVDRSGLWRLSKRSVERRRFIFVRFELVDGAMFVLIQAEDNFPRGTIFSTPPLCLKRHSNIRAPTAVRTKSYDLPLARCLT